MKKIDRRKFIFCSTAFLSGALPASAFWPFGESTGKNKDNSISHEKQEASGKPDIRGKIFKGDAPKKLWKWSKEGFLYTKIKNNRVMCGICPNHCVLSPGFVLEEIDLTSHNSRIQLSVGHHTEIIKYDFKLFLCLLESGGSFVTQIGVSHIFIR